MACKNTISAVDMFTFLCYSKFPNRKILVCQASDIYACSYMYVSVNLSFVKRRFSSTTTQVRQPSPSLLGRNIRIPVNTIGRVHQ